jgi:hypothetical protein
MERGAVCLPEAGRLFSHVQLFDGRFRLVDDEARSWSAAVIRCTDGLALFEHPEPLNPLHFRTLRELVALEGYSPTESFHRYSEGDWEGLWQRLEAVETALDFYAGVGQWDSPEG